MTEPISHKQSVRAAFDRAAASYDDAAAIQREICHRLAAHAFPTVKAVTVERVLDAGCGTGYGLKILSDAFPAACRIAVDFAPRMLDLLARSNAANSAVLPVCGDLECLPFAPGSFDLLWSSLALQWCDPQRSFAEIARVLRPGGVACIATLGPRTLYELGEAFQGIDEAEHVIHFHEPDFWQAAAERSGLQTLLHVREDAFALAPDLRHLLRDIKAIGAHSVGERRRRKPLGRKAWHILESRYETHRRSDGQLPATYDLILLTLRKP